MKRCIPNNQTRAKRNWVPAGIALLISFCWCSHSLAESNGRLLRPSRIVWLQDHLLVLNATGGSLSVIDPATGHVNNLKISATNEPSDSAEPSAEMSDARYSDMAVLDSRHLAVLDQMNGMLIVLRIDQSDAKAIGYCSVGHSPVNLIAQGDHLFVANLWARRWTNVTIRNKHDPIVTRTLHLSFSPRHQIALADGSVFVLDAFGGQWALIDAAFGTIRRQGQFTGSHNISGVAIDHSNGQLLIPHLTLNAEKPTTKFNVHWGDVILNVVRRLRIADLANGRAVDDDFYYLGRPDIAAGDPTRIIISDKGRQIVAFAGRAEIGISDIGANSFDRVQVGCRPVDFVLSPDEEYLYVVNQLDDSVSVIRVADKVCEKTITLSDSVTDRTLVEEGERLFFDARLSSDGWFSCHSCHTEGHSNGGLADTFGDGFAGDAKRVPTLLGVSKTGPWSWNGEQDHLAQQIRKSIETTMRGETPTTRQIAALEAYVKSLQPPPSVVLARNELSLNRLERGHRHFLRVGCVECHAEPIYTSDQSYDVEFADASGNHRFNPPSLLGVSQRPRLLHDNRAQSVKEVVETFRHQYDGELSRHELDDLIYFVESL